MQYFVDQVLNGLSLGCIYAFIALGYTMVYGIIKLINFAHGEFFMVGSFVGYFALMYLGVEMAALPHPIPVVLAVFVAIFLAGLGSAVLAVVTERIAYRPLMGASRIAALLTALGVSLFLQNLGIQVFTAEQKGYPEARQYVPMEDAEQLRDKELPGSAFVRFEVENFSGDLTEVREVVGRSHQPFDPSKLDEFKGRKWDGKKIKGFYIEHPIDVFWKKTLIIVALIISFGLLWLVVHRTQLGRAMRAVSNDAEAAQLMGISSSRVISATFFIGAFLAGIGGVIWGIRYGKVEPFMGFLPGLKAFIAAVLGGIGSLPGAVVGGVLLGLLEVLVPAYLPSAYTGYKDGVAFILLIVILLVRPSGLLGEPTGQKI